MTRDEVQNMMESNNNNNNGDNVGGVRSTTPDVEPPVVEALTPPPTMEKKDVEIDELGGLDNLDPEIVALLRADMG